MFLALPLLLLLQGAAPQPPGRARPADSAAVDSARRARRTADSIVIADRRAARRIPLTPALEASAFQDPGARTLVTLARSARLGDTLLKSYEATRVARISLGAQVRLFGRERLAFRQESASRIRWQRGVGAYIDVTGGRQAVPIADDRVTAVRNAGLLSTADIPYYPGREVLWPLGEFTLDEGEPWWLHPLADGAEAYYRYASGDSTDIRLSEGALIRIAEVRIEPRAPRWDLVVGSFWFDRRSGQLVRAAYRPSVPLNIESLVELDGEDFPSWFPSPVFTISSVLLEFGLQGGRYWLPTLQSFTGDVQALVARLPIEVDQRYRYLDVNSIDSLQPIAVVLATDSARRDSLRRIARDTSTIRQRQAAAREGRQASCRTYGYWEQVRRADSLAILTRVPCDTAALLHSPDLPPSIFASGESLFSPADRAFLERALSLTAQPGWAPQRPTVAWGFANMRYNRVEGLTPGVRVDEAFGRGYAATLSARYAFAEQAPRAEVTVAKSDGERSIGVGAYRRLAVTNDWGSPLSFGSSLRAVLFGYDDGFYYDARGIEVIATGTQTGSFSWRLFAEQQRDVDVHTQFSLGRSWGDARFIPNIDAQRADVIGVASQLTRSFGDDPRGLRTFTDLRVEAGGGDVRYARAMGELSVSRPLYGKVAGAISAGAGSSRGVLPPQRRWYIGGLYTVRGEAVRAREGDAYWMARGELARGIAGFRPVVFYDVGWAGDRTTWREPGRPISGAGTGVSILDGLFRFDLARGIYPSTAWRAGFYMDARF